MASAEGTTLTGLLIVGSYPKRIVDHVRKLTSTWCGGVDMQAFVSALCAHAGHELCDRFLCLFSFLMWARAGGGAGVAPQKAAAFAVDRPYGSLGGSRGGPGPFSQKSSRFVARVILQACAAYYVRMRKSTWRRSFTRKRL